MEEKQSSHVRLRQPEGMSYSQALEVAVAACPQEFVAQQAVMVHGMRVVAHSLDDAEWPAARLAEEWRRWCAQWEAALRHCAPQQERKSVADVVAAKVSGLRSV